jgi:hypothetical protein
MLEIDAVDTSGISILPAIGGQFFEVAVHPFSHTAMPPEYLVYWFD